jgi:phosphatidylserine/phosphatidylglycerophosphate/cardiolipin synthase-like enzyme
MNSTALNIAATGTKAYPGRMASTELLTGSALHTRVIQQAVLSAEQHVWIATANLKDMHVAMARGRYAPILEIFDRMAKGGVTFRIIHSDLPSRPFRRTLERFPYLTDGALELQICPRSHWKMALIDGRQAYLGSANFTGAGLGAKSPGRRNLEIGIVSTETSLVARLVELFDSFWLGAVCGECAYKKSCPDPIETS